MLSAGRLAIPATALALFLAGSLSSARAQDPTRSHSFGDRVARFFSPTVREADQRLRELDRDLASLPQLYNGDRGSRYGFHSARIASQTEPHWLQIDLQASCSIDSIVLVPVSLPLRAPSGEGYGFPRRFKIEIGEEREADRFEVVVDHTAADFENPGRYPLKFDTPGAQGRFVRLTSTKHVPHDDGFIWALEEFLVLSGNLNVAAGRAREASSHEDLFPNWSIFRVNDGISRLGKPEDLEPSPTKGFLSAPSETSKVDKWLIVDLGESRPIDEVRLIPTDSDDPEVVGGRGFPTNIILELSNDRSFASPTWRSASRRHPLGHPWSSPFIRPADGAQGRYLKVRAEELFARGNKHSFALAEIQAYSRGANVALNQPVLFSDRTTHPASSGWAPEFVVDGYSSTRRLIELPEFVERIVERGALEKERALLLRRREEKIEIASASVTAGVGTVGGVAVFGWIWMIMRQRTVRRRDAEQLREQIARDLHDDIGSNLGGIVLLSEVGSLHAKADPEIQRDFREIKETAEYTSEAMRDIVWLIHAGRSDLRNLIIKMRESVETILGDLKTTIDTEPVEFRNRTVGLLVRRHVFFAFKETLNNIRKHAQATSVSVRLVIGSHRLTFEIVDDGVGFDAEDAKERGHGLGNLQRRAERVHGECTIESKLGRGTTVTFSAPLRK